MYCLECEKQLKFIHGSSKITKSHMNSIHRDYLINYRNAQIQITTPPKTKLKSRKCPDSNRSPSYTPTKQPRLSDIEHANNIVVKWLTKDLRPFTIVEDLNLRELITFIQSTRCVYQLPSRRTITDKVEIEADHLQKKLRTEIKTEALYYSLTCDMWTSRTMESYLSLTVHYITENFDIKSRSIEVKPFRGKHTGINIAESIMVEIESWGLDKENITKIIRDNGANIKKACRDLNISNFSCVAHSLHLVLHAALSNNITFQNIGEHSDQFVYNETETQEDETDAASGELEVECNDLISQSYCEIEIKQAFTEIRTIVAKFRKIVVYFKRSSKALDKLKALQNSKPKTLINGVCTRWNSTLIMISRLIELRAILDLFFNYAATPTGRAEFSDLDLQQPAEDLWFNLICLERILIHFDKMTKVLSGEKYATAPIIFPSICLLKRILLDDNACQHGLNNYSLKEYYIPTLCRMKKIRKGFIYLLDKRFSDFPCDVKHCSILDPRFVQGQHLTADMKSEAAVFIQAEAVEIAKQSSLNVEFSAVDETDEVNWDDKYDFTHMLFSTPKKRKKVSHSNSPSESIPLDILVQKQFSAYLTDAIDYTKDACEQVNPLNYWRSRKLRYPLIANVARKYFGVVATSVPSERNFSTAGNNVTVRRANLTGKNVRNIVFLHNNLSDD